MEYRYLGFDQQQNTRVYRFDRFVKGEAPVHFVVTADLGLFRTHHVGIQDGPSLCAQKLSSGLAVCDGTEIHLTTEDIQAHAYERRQAESRKPATARRRPADL